MKIKKIIFSLYLVLFIFSILVSAQEGDDDYVFDLKKTFDEEIDIKDEGSVYFNGNIKSRQIIDEQNLGNTLDA